MKIQHCKKWIQSGCDKNCKDFNNCQVVDNFRLCESLKNLNERIVK